MRRNPPKITNGHSATGLSIQISATPIGLMTLRTRVICGLTTGNQFIDVSGLFGGAGFWVRQAGRGIDGAVKLAELVAKYGYWAARDKVREIMRRRNNPDDYDDDEDEDEDEDWDIGFEDNS